jgi:hypothetical protein
MHLLRTAGCPGLADRPIPAAGADRAPRDPSRMLTKREHGTQHDLRFLRDGAAARTGGSPKVKAPKEFRDSRHNAARRPPLPSTRPPRAAA